MNGPVVNSIVNLRTHEVLFSHVFVPTTFLKRTLGLMGQKALEEGAALMITRCGSIHTHFMRFAMDAIFVDKDLKVQSIYKNIKPWRFVFAGPTSYSVIEFTSDYFDYRKIRLGDQLSVGN